MAYNNIAHKVNEVDMTTEKLFNDKWINTNQFTHRHYSVFMYICAIGSRKPDN